ncbi:MAG: hypothetical protein AAGJ37_16315 [Pseudomonadota bacterium]
MIYFLSGASRSGKTLIAREILEEANVSYLSLDWLLIGFDEGLTKVGTKHLSSTNEVAKKMWPALKKMIDNMLCDGEDCVIEGEALSPELMAELRAQYPDEVKVAFLGFDTIDVKKKVSLIKSNTEKENDWLASESDAYIQDHVNNMIRYSKMIKTACKKHNLSYFDTSEDFENATQRVKKFLLS